MKIVLTLTLFLLNMIGYSQSIEMADQMRSNGKIYVVVAVLLTILIGLLIYLISIDRKLSKIEKEMESK